MNERIARWTRVGLTVALLFGALSGGASAHAPSITPTTVVALYQTPVNVHEQTAFTIFLKVASSANVQQVYFTYCQLTSSVCYLPVVMTDQGGNWFAGTTKPMTDYPGMTVGITAGYNITIVYSDNSTSTVPSIPNPFANLTVAQTVTGEYVYAVTVIDHQYNLTGHVYDSASGTSLGGATVTLAPGNGTTTSTDAAGAYTFVGLFNGTYTISVTRAGFRISNESVAITGQDTVKDVQLANTTNTAPHDGTGGRSRGRSPHRRRASRPCSSRSRAPSRSACAAGGRST